MRILLVYSFKECAKSNAKEPTTLWFNTADSVARVEIKCLNLLCSGKLANQFPPGKVITATTVFFILVFFEICSALIE